MSDSASPRDDDDRFASWDAAYVVGALSPADRAEFERHVETCRRCADAIAELAVMPALLALVSGDAVSALTKDHGPVPDTLLPGLVARTRAARRGRLRTVVGGAAAACLVVVAALTWTGWPASLTRDAARHDTRAVELISARSLPVQANVRLRPVAWGTALQVRCTYNGPGAPAGSPRSTYALVLVPADGGPPQRVADWRTSPGADVVADASTSLRIADISSIELQAGDGTVLLRAKPPGNVR